jgi:alkanesulfonate monooxygenase SsuD/methylene tetrahydromethanopterin reductase-like flavin-dependent oxidoreductase (luciferase family)
MKFGIFSNGMRTNKVAADSYEADLEEIVAADRLGYHEAWVSEHLGAWFPDTVAHADLLIAKAAGLTKQIKLGPAVRLLPLFHPMDVAISAGMCDQMLRGRYLLGVGTGVPFLRNMERRGLTNDMRHSMMMESLDYIQKCWTSTEPFDWGGDHWPGTGVSVAPMPYQKPHPPIAVATSQEAVVRVAAERGWILMVGQFDAPEAIRARADAYVAAARQAGVKVDRNKVTVARHIHVSDSVKKARDELRSDVEGSLEQWKQRDPGRFRGFLPASGRVEDVTYDQAFDSGLFIGGDPDTVYKQLKDVYDRAGGFGTLLLVMGKDWGAPQSRTRSLKLFMREVAPRLARLNANRARRTKDIPDGADTDDKTLTAAAY